MHVPLFTYQRGGKVACSCSCGAVLGRHRDRARAREAFKEHTHKPDEKRARVAA